MVFECYRCNETVKKPKMAKHLLSCGSEWVTCIDCNKRFSWEEWESHTTCISEAQKYQGKLFQGKESGNKGKLKQDTWTENVQKAIEDAGSSISPQTKGHLEKLLGFDNIPRKQKPFTNFVKNSLKLWDEKKINEIWAVISAATAKKPEQTPPAAAPPKETAAEKKSEAKWAGWKRALDTELLIAGGELPWKKLRDAVVRRYHAESSEPNGVDEAQLCLQCLSAVPDAYLSKEDELVRYPKA